VEVMLGEFMDESVEWLKVAKQLGLRFFTHAHGYDISRQLKEERWIRQYQEYEKADGVITISRYSKSALEGIGLESRKIHVVPYGVAIPNSFQERIDHHEIRCIAVGRMVAKKAPIFLLDAFRRAHQVNPSIQLDLVGTGPLFPAAQQFIRAFGLERVVRLHAARPNDSVHALMKEADIFLQHSITDSLTGNQEGLPVAILEAMAFGLPVVSTRHAGIGEAVQEGITGYLVEEGDTSSMAERLLELAGDRGLRCQLGKAGYLQAKNNFSSTIQLAKLRNLLGLPNDGSSN
jgi:colanic acid/amylovoran biosynthesis glycosyltransferase